MVPRRYYEIDFEDVTRMKVNNIRRNSAVGELLKNPKFTDCEISSENYFLISADLRNFDSVSRVLISEKFLDTSLPTLFLSECVLVYMEPVYSDKIVRWAADTFEEAVFVTYEQILPGDAFGKQMIHNLKVLI